MHSRFIQCGLYGWGLEIFWTGLRSLFHHDPRGMGFSSLLMFPAYGLASLIRPLSHLLKKCKASTRGFVYMLCIFTVEYLYGSFLKRKNCCPWNYHDCTFQIKEVIRLDYAPLWFLTGLFFEHI